MNGMGGSDSQFDDLFEQFFGDANVISFPLHVFAPNIWPVEQASEHNALPAEIAPCCLWDPDATDLIEAARFTEHLNKVAEIIKISKNILNGLIIRILFFCSFYVWKIIETIIAHNCSMIF